KSLILRSSRARTNTRTGVWSDELLTQGNARLHFQRLPYSSAEATAIADLLPEKERRIIQGFDATVAAVTTAESQRYRILHFATHAVVFGEDPKLYGVVLSLVDRRGNVQDGYLRLNQVYNL